MGPPLFSGGNDGCLQQFAKVGGPLQWGRRCSAAEIPFRRDLEISGVHASMGPPLFSGGNSSTAFAPWTGCRGFNGAAAVQRRKSRLNKAGLMIWG